MTKNEMKFVVWVRKTHPALYKKAISKTPGKMGGMGGWIDMFTSTVSNIAPKYLQYKQQKTLMKMQLKRAERGLPPAKVADYTPVISTRVDLAPETRQAVIKSGQKAVQPLIYGLLGLGAVFLIMKKK